MAKQMTVDELLDEAAEVIIANGWRRFERGNTNSREGSKCIIGALYTVTRGGHLDVISQASIAVLTEIRESYSAASVADWNDHYAKDKRQVIRLLRRTARKLRGAKR